MRALRVLLAVALVVPLAGCTLPLPWSEGPTGFGDVPRPTRPTPEPSGPPIAFAGIVLDVVTGEPLEDADVRIDLAQTRPCRREGIVWNAWPTTTANGGGWGPIEIARPRSDDVAFFLHASHAGYAPLVLFIGPIEARGDLGNLTLHLHPAAAVTGHAPPGTLVALDAPGFPRVTVTDDDGAFVFEHARAEARSLVIAHERPHRETVTPPADVAAWTSHDAYWQLEGTLRLESGAPIAADVVAWENDTLASVGRAGDNGVFVLPLAAKPASLRLEARTADTQYGSTRNVELSGPPALREQLIMRPLC